MNQQNQSAVTRVAAASAHNSPNAVARPVPPIVVPAVNVAIEKPGVVEVRPTKQRRKLGKQGTRTWTMDMDMELMKCWNMVGLYNHLAYGEKGAKERKLVGSFENGSTTATKGSKIKALKGI